MEFHHVDESQKEMTIGSSWRKVSLERLIAELAKCVVVCANDHLRIHAGTAQIPSEELL